MACVTDWSGAGTGCCWGGCVAMTATRIPPRAAQSSKLLALKQANRVRFLRADLRRDLQRLAKKDGCVRVAALLGSPPDWACSMLVLDLLTLVNHVGDSLAEAHLMKAEIGFGRRVGELSPRQARILGWCLTGNGCCPTCGHDPLGGSRLRARITVLMWTVATVTS
jgi:hypothetical protein